MKINKKLLVCLMLSLMVIGTALAAYLNPPVLKKSLYTKSFGDMAVAKPLWGSKGLVLVFVDTKKFSLISSVTIAAEERSTIKFDVLPDSVRTTVTNFIDQDNITKIEKVTDRGYVKFEILSTKTVNNKDFIDTDMIVAADGAIIKMAKEVPYFDIPFPITYQLNQLYPNLKVDEVESVQTRYFQLTGKNNGQPVNLKIFDDGEIQDLTVGQNSKNNSPTKQTLDQTINKPITPKPGNDELPDPTQDDELKIEGSDDIFHLNPNQ